LSDTSQCCSAEFSHSHASTTRRGGKPPHCPSGSACRASQCSKLCHWLHTLFFPTLISALYQLPILYLRERLCVPLGNFGGHEAQLGQQAVAPGRALQCSKLRYALQTLCFQPLSQLPSLDLGACLCAVPGGFGGRGAELGSRRPGPPAVRTATRSAIHGLGQQ